MNSSNPEAASRTTITRSKLEEFIERENGHLTASLMFVNIQHGYCVVTEDDGSPFNPKVRLKESVK